MRDICTIHLFFIPLHPNSKQTSMMVYKQRIVDALLDRKLQGKGAVLIEGPKWCGKTTTAKQQAKTVLDLGNTVVLRNALEAYQIKPMSLLEGATPKLIDEWQSIPELWDMVRSEVDNQGKVAQFILAGSSTPIEVDKLRHSGIGRIGRLNMRTMSLWESGESTGAVSLDMLFDGADFEPQDNPLDLTQIAYLLCRGGWPQATFLKGEIALDQARDYYETIYKIDIQRVDKTRRNSERTRLLLRSYARNVATSISLNKMAADVKENDNMSITYETISDYINALKKLFVLEDAPAWNPNLRSKTAIQSSDTRYFTDPSIAAAALGIGPKDLENDLQTFGLFFENMAIRDLRVYADALDGNIYHFRDAEGLECDAVLHKRNGTYGLIEIKLGGPDNIDKAADTLHTLAAKINTDKMKGPAFMLVLTAVGTYAYHRKDGVYVVPIGCLKP